MIKKKKLCEDIEELKNLIREKDQKIDALRWCLEHPKFITIESNLNVTANLVNLRFPQDLIITYFNKFQCKVMTETIVRVIDGDILNPSVSYKMNNGELEVQFGIKYRSGEIKYFKYQNSLYDLVGRKTPRVFIRDLLSKEWVGLPYVSNHTDDYLIDPVIF